MLNLDLGQKIKKIELKTKNMLASQEVTFLSINKKCSKEIYLVFSETEFKNKSLKYEKVRN